MTHSEYNPSSEEHAHLLQIWILPKASGLTPGYEQKRFVDFQKPNTFHLIASENPAGAPGAVKVHQDVQLYSVRLESGQQARYELDPQRHAWIQVVRGEIQLGDHHLHAGDGAAVSEESLLSFQGKDDAEFLLFDLA